MVAKQKVSQLHLEKLGSGDLTDAEKKALLESLELEADGPERLEQLKESDRQILDEYPPHVMATQIREKHEKEELSTQARHPSWIPLTASLVTVAAAAMVIAVMAPGFTAPRGEQSVIEQYVGDTSLKGDYLKAFRKTGASEQKLDERTTVSKNDIIQLKYISQGIPYGVIFSRDGRGSVTLHFPEQPDRSTGLAEKGYHPLPYSYELDDAPGFEHFYFVVSKKQIDVKAVLDAAKEFGDDPSTKLPLPEGVELLDQIRLVKTPTGS